MSLGIRLGVLTSVWSHEGIPLLQSLERAVGLGISLVEVFGRGHGDPRYLSQQQVRACANFVEQEGLEVAAFTSLLPANPASPSAQATKDNWEYFQRSLNAAETLGTKKVLHIAGEKQRGASRRDAWQRAVAFTQRCCVEAANCGIFLLIEFEPTVASLVRDLETLAAFRDDVGHPNCMFNLDTGHLNVIRVGAEEIRSGSLLSNVLHVHLSDNRGLVDAHDDLGSGTTDNAGLLAAVAASGAQKRCARLGIGDAAATVELHHHLVPPFARRPADESVSIAWNYANTTLMRAVADWQAEAESSASSGTGDS